MPYRHAWVFIAALMAATIFGFWRSYFGIILSAPMGFHVHGVTASLWMLLLLAQSWTPHRGRIALHRRLGRATFVALPLFAAGSMGVVHSMAAGTAGGDPFYALWGVALTFIDMAAFCAVIYAAGMALRHRRNARLHAGYMLSTALPLVSPVLGRVINRTVPGLIVNGPKDFAVFGAGVQLANLIAAMLAIWMWRRDPRSGKPWAVALGVIVIQIIGFELVGGSDAAHAMVAAIGRLPLAAMMGFGLLAGAAAIAWGWRALAQPARWRPKPAE